MPDLLALEWDHDQICGVQAQVSPGKVRIKRCFAAPRPTAPAGVSGPLPVAFLQQTLSGLGITGGEVLVALPRDEAVVKRMELPETGDDELPVLVRFQAGAKSSVPLNELSLDFLPLPRRNEVPGREVLMATVPQQTISEIRTLCEMAGLQLSTLGLVPAAIAELLARAEPAPTDDPLGASLVVALHGTRLEISVYRRCHLLFAHSARLSIEEAGPEPQAIAAEVSRSLVALRGTLADVKIERAWTLLDPAAHDQLAEVLRKRLGCGVEPLNPLAMVECDPSVERMLDRTLHSGPIGLLLSRADARVPRLDFLAPRQPPVKRDERKRRAAVLAVFGGVLALLLAGFYWWKLSSLDAEIELLAVEDTNLTQLLERGAPIVKAASIVKLWEENDPQWLDRLDELSERMPGTDRIFLKALKFEPRSANGPAKFDIEGYAREQADVQKLTDRLLAADKRYAVRIPTPKRKDNVQYYPYEFRGDILLIEPSKKADKGAKAPGGAPQSAAKGPRA